MSPILRVAFALLAGGLAGCTQSAAPNLAVSAASYQSEAPANQAETQVITAAAAGAAKAGPTISLASAGIVGSGMTIAPMDVLDITVFQVADLSGTFTVDASGQIDFPLIGAVVAGGKTIEELKAELTKQLGDKYLQSPDVRVVMKEAVSQRITVAGAVNHPGVFPTTGPTTLIQIMAMAGGFDPTADPRGVVVFRHVNGKRVAAKFDYRAIRDGKADDPVLAGGDVVMVDESGMKATLKGLRDSLGLFGLFAPVAAFI